MSVLPFRSTSTPRPVSPFARGEVLGMERAPVEPVRKRAPGGEEPAGERGFIEPVPCRLAVLPVPDVAGAGLMDAAAVLRVVERLRRS